ncbi:MAG: universal stress protein [Terracidiphilus sp.]
MAGGIIEVVDREHIDLIVISTHRISGSHPMIFGSIAEKVVKLAQRRFRLFAQPSPIRI